MNTITKVFTKYDILCSSIMVPYFPPIGLKSVDLDFSYGYKKYIPTKIEEGLEGVKFIIYGEERGGIE